MVGAIQDLERRARGNAQGSRLVAENLLAQEARLAEVGEQAASLERLGGRLLELSAMFQLKKSPSS